MSEIDQYIFGVTWKWIPPVRGRAEFHTWLQGSALSPKGLVFHARGYVKGSSNLLFEPDCFKHFGNYVYKILLFVWYSYTLYIFFNFNYYRSQPGNSVYSILRLHFGSWLVEDNILPYSGWAFSGLLPKNCHTYPTMMKFGTVIPYLKTIQKIHKLRDTILKFCWRHHFFTGNQQLLLCQKMQI